MSPNIGQRGKDSLLAWSFSGTLSLLHEQSGKYAIDVLDKYAQGENTLGTCAFKHQHFVFDAFWVKVS